MGYYNGVENKRNMGGKRMRCGVLFDMDGVISDTERFYVEAMIERLRREGITATPAELSSLFGSTMRHNCGILKERYGLAKDADTYVDEIHEIKEQLLVAQGLRPMPGAVELIQKLHAAGVLMAVASSSPREVIEHHMEAFGIMDCFDTIVSGVECREGKPAPEIYLRAAENLGLQPSECVVIEDSCNGVKAGKAAGMYCYAYVPPQAYRQDVSAADDRLESFCGLEPEDILRG